MVYSARMRFVVVLALAIAAGLGSVAAYKYTQRPQAQPARSYVPSWVYMDTLAEDMWREAERDAQYRKESRE